MPTGLQTERLFATEADADPEFAKATSILPRAGESEEGLRAALTSQNWVVLTGDKGSGKTSYLFFGLRELPPNKVEAIVRLEQEKILSYSGSWKALRRQGQKAEMMVMG